MILQRLAVPFQRVLRAPGSVAPSSCALALLGMATAVQAGPFATEVLMERLDQNDRLVINRGGPVHNAGDVDGNGFDDLIVAPGVGSVRVIFGPQAGSNGVIDVRGANGSNGFVIAGEFSTVSGGGDMNGDGLADVVVGGAERVHVVYGRRAAFPSTLDPDSLDGSNGFRFDAPGDSVAIVPDINGDGLADLLVGSEHVDTPTHRDGGRVAIIHGRSGTGPARLGPFNLDGSNGSLIHGEGTLALLGWASGEAGDMNGDGLGDIALGSPGLTVDGDESAGRAYVLFGATESPAVRTLGQLDGSDGFRFSGSQVEATVGYSVRSAGDLDGDGRDDLAIGAPGKGPFGLPSTYPGEAHVLFGGDALSASLTADDLDGQNGLTVRGIRGGTVPVQEGVIAWGDQLGSSVAGAGDINADGKDDLVIGAPYTIINNDRRGNGHVYVVYGRDGGFPREIALDRLDGENGFRWTGVGTTDYTGASVSPAGDFNDDGIDDIFVGASGQGESYVFYGKAGAVNP